MSCPAATGHPEDDQMKKSLLFYLLLLSSVLPSFASSSGAKPDSLKFAAFRTAADSIPGWTEHQDKYLYFVPKALYDIINGGAEEYIKTGLVDGMVATFKSAGNKNAELYIEDFGVQGRAQALVKKKRKTASEPKPLPGSRDKNAFYDEVIGGCIVYFSSGRYYFEMTLTGYDKQAAALLDARLFVERLMGKVK
jgi:hypothetical protein